MASKRFVEGSVERRLFQEYCILCQRYWEVEDTEEYWRQVTDAAGEFMQHYEGNVFANKIAMAFLESLERKLSNYGISKQRESGLSGRSPF